MLVPSSWNALNKPSNIKAGGDFADGVIVFDGDLLGGTDFVSFDYQAVKLLKVKKRNVRLFGAFLAL